MTKLNCDENKNTFQCGGKCQPDSFKCDNNSERKELTALADAIKLTKKQVYNKEMLEEWENTFFSAPDDLKAKIENTVSPGFKEPTDSTKYHYDEKTQELYLGNLDSFGKFEGSVFRHEYGHHLDSVNGITKNKDFIKARINDGNKLIDERESGFRFKASRYKEESLNMAYERVPQKQRDMMVKRLGEERVQGLMRNKAEVIIQTEIIPREIKNKLNSIDPELGDLFENMDESEKADLTYELQYNNQYHEASYAMATLGAHFADTGTAVDMMGALTNNRLGRGHDDAYYRADPARKDKEIFANLTSMYGTSNISPGLLEKYANKYFPETWAQYKKGIQQ